MITKDEREELLFLAEKQAQERRRAWLIRMWLGGRDPDA